MAPRTVTRAPLISADRHSSQHGDRAICVSSANEVETLVEAILLLAQMTVTVTRRVRPGPWATKQQLRVMLLSAGASILRPGRHHELHPNRHAVGVSTGRDAHRRLTGDVEDAGERSEYPSPASSSPVHVVSSQAGVRTRGWVGSGCRTRS